MPNCKTCAAPLPPYSSRCEYCGAKSDVDLKGIQEYTITQAYSQRHCPLCSLPMESITLNEIPGFTIERCPKCMGLFFDPEELNALLDASVNQVYSINLRKIWEMNQMAGQDNERTAVYIQCPVCKGLMNRVNFGARSGVVIDKCIHGIWLDNGELRKLLEWRKAGGQLYHETVVAERLKQEELIRKKKEEEKNKVASSMYFTDKSSQKSPADIDLEKLFGTVAKAIWRLFV
ncbi:MAG: zf-TFIIB domain-containing protein [Chitinispirillaceae bacterium]|nr:zf-TFIIB domain-containing protein [Chitinispirillaceae bacterium]